MTRLFISYARKDGRELADRIAADVRPHEAWLDRNEIAGGETWTEEIETAIDACDVFLVVLTPAYGDSLVCRNELSRAIRKEKRRIPLLAHPAADPTLLFEGLHWIDFTDSTAREASMRALVDCIDHPPAPEAPKSASLEWNATVARGAKQARRFVRQHEGTFNAGLYVRRDDAEQELAKFMAGDAHALIVIGDSGVGKTSLLCNWTLALLEQGHALIAYDCSALSDIDLESEIARDLVVPANEIAVALERMDAEASNAERKLIIVFESVGDYLGKDKTGPEDLFKRISAFAGRAGEHTRVVLTCNAATWNRVQRSRPIRFDRAQCAQLGVFTPEELDRAYRRYREFFELQSDLDDLSPVVRERLREPVMLRLTAEAFRNSKDPLPPANLAAGVYKRFFQERVRMDNEQVLVDELAGEMIRRRTGTLSMNDLARDDRLGPKLLTEDAGSPYVHLLDCGVLQELRTDARAGTLIKFAHARLAAYALASHLWKQPEDVKTTAETLVAQDDDFPLAWEVAKTLLLISGDRGAITALATSSDSEQRELAAEALVELHAENALGAHDLLLSLFRQNRVEGQRTALKAAYNIGPRTQDFFLAAIEDAPPMREAVRNTLYLIWRRATTEAFYVIWRQAPEFTYEILIKLLDELRPGNLIRAPAIFSFVVDLTVTIYINHCDDERVIARTAELLHKLWIERLHLNRLGSWFEKIISTVLGAVFGRQILDWMLFSDDLPAEVFFDLPKEDRDRLGRIGDVFDPASDVTAAHDDLRTMLRSGVPIFSGSAAMAVAVHACHDFAKTKPLIDTLWNEIGANGRLWLLVGFSVLMKDTPDPWVSLLETLTGKYVNDHRDVFRDGESRLPGNLDVVFLPLGLAYGKRGVPSMPFFDALLQEGIAQGDAALLTRCVAALGVVGFYYPEAMFEVIRPLMVNLDGGAIRTALVANLATVRTLHFDAVDRFLGSAGASDDLRHDIDVAADVELVRRYIRVLGYYNNAVHFTLNYPRMRKPLSTGALKLLATARDANQFVTDYTETAMRMLRESDYQVLEWTRPE